MRYKLTELILLALLLGMIFLAAMIAQGKEKDDKKILINSIEQVCFNEKYTLDKKEQCILFFTNCTIQKNSKWTDGRLFECLKRWKKVQKDKNEG